MTMKLSAITAAAFCCILPLALEPNDAEEAAVKQTALDYLDAIYLGKPELIKKSVHPKLNKAGFRRKSGDQGFREGKMMTYRQLLTMTRKAEAEYPANPLRGIEILDLLDVIASVRIKAEWGYDYMLLAKVKGAWKIRQILWQSFEHPTAPEITDELLATGKELFVTGMCFKCHGDDGSGTKRAPNLRDDDWIHCDGEIEGIKDVIVAGVDKEDFADSTRPFAMNPIGSRLELADEDLYALAAYVNSLSQN